MGHQQTLPPEIRPLERGMRLAGPAYTVKGGPRVRERHTTRRSAILAMLGDVPAGHVAVYACEHDVSAHLGELSATSLQARGVAGCVLDGGCRDVALRPRRGLPGLLPLRHARGLDLALGARGDQVPVTIGLVRIEPGDWIVGDDDGVVVVPHAIAEEVLAEAEQKAATESEIRVAVRGGMPPLEAYERFGTF